jgi:hypothetical protein
LHCIGFQFKESLQAYEKAERSDSLKEMVLKFHQRTLPVTIDLKLEVLAETVKIHGINRPASDFVHKQIYSDFSIEERVQFVRGSLALFNNHIAEIHFNFDPLTSHLDVSNNPELSWGFALQNFPAKSVDISRTDINFFKNIRAIDIQKLNASHTGMKDFSFLTLKNIRSLNISYTRIRNLAPLKRSAVQILDIRHTPIKSLEPLVGLKYLHQLIIHPGQFQERELKLIPKQIEIKILD